MAHNKYFLTTFFIVINLVFADLNAGAPKPEKQECNITAKDKLVLKGEIFKPENYYYFFVLLHGLGSSKEEWLLFQNLLEASGHGYFAYDARGHGASSKTNYGTTVDYRAFRSYGSGTPWEAMITDLDSVISYLRKNFAVKSENLVLTGASLGANICLKAAINNRNIKYLLLLSPGINYAGIDITNTINSIKNKIIVVCASESDPYAYKSSTAVARNTAANNKTRFIQPAKQGHGVNMFGDGLENEILDIFGSESMPVLQK